MRNSRRRLIRVVILVAVVACAGSAVAYPHSFRCVRRTRPLFPGHADCAFRPRPGEISRSGFPPEAVPSAVRWPHGLRCARCFEGTGAGFARLYSDSRDRVLSGGILPGIRDAAERGRQHPCPGAGADRGEREVRQLFQRVDRPEVLAEAETLVDRRDSEGSRPRRGRQGWSGMRRASGRTTSTGAASRTSPRTRPRTTRARRRTPPSTTARASSTGAAWRTTRTAAGRSPAR